MLETKVTRILTNSPPGATSLETESQYVSLKIAAGGTFNELIHVTYLIWQCLDYIHIDWQPSTFVSKPRLYVLLLYIWLDLHDSLIISPLYLSYPMPIGIDTQQTCSCFNIVIHED